MREFRKKISSAPSLSPYLLVEIHGFSSKEVLENSKIYGETWPEGVFVLSLEELYLTGYYVIKQRKFLLAVSSMQILIDVDCTLKC